MTSIKKMTSIESKGHRALALETKTGDSTATNIPVNAGQTPKGTMTRKGKRGPVRQTAEARAKIATGMRRYYADPANRKKRSEAAKAGWDRKRAELDAKLARLEELEREQGRRHDA